MILDANSACPVLLDNLVHALTAMVLEVLERDPRGVDEALAVARRRVLEQY